jgi:hypothetical protein
MYIKPYPMRSCSLYMADAMETATTSETRWTAQPLAWVGTYP